MILESVENGPLIWATIKENEVTRPKKYSELSATKAIQADCDVKATNIILQGLPPEVYALVSNHRIAKELWERIQLLMQGTSLTKQERECKLYDEFDKFAYKKGETLRDFYLRFSLLLNDMNIYNVKLEQFQVNTKFLNTLPLEWSTDPLALVATHQMTQSPYQTHQNSSKLSISTTSFTILVSTILGRSSRHATVIISKCGLNKLMILMHDSDCMRYSTLAKGCSPMAMPSSEQSSVVNNSNSEITNDSNIIPYSQYMKESQQVAVQNSNSSAQQDALILSVIEQLKTQVIKCTKINLDNKSVNDTLTAELERYKEQVKVLKEGQNVGLKSKDNISDSCEQSVEIDHLKQTLSEHLKEKKSLMQTVTLLKNDFKKEEYRNIDRKIALEKKIKQLDNIKAQQLEPKLYDGNVIKNTSAIVIPDSEETLVLAEESRSKMLLKQQDPMMLEKKNSMNSSDIDSSCRPTKVEVLKELPKVSMVNTSLKKLKHHLASFDVVVKERTTVTAITEGSLGFEHTKACFRDEIIPFVKALKDLFNTFDQYLIDELSEVQNVSSNGTGCGTTSFRVQNI
ncbi:hypothetical protein Tco_0482536 [Tanacetum coccineum]